MLEVKVQCDCGQRYKFDVEPVGGRMPFPVNCPMCGSDGTEKANEVLRRGGGVPTVPVAALVPAPAVAVTQARVVSTAPRVRLNTTAPQAPATTSSESVAPAPETVSPVGTIAGHLQPVANATQTVASKKPSFALGMLGGAVGALVGALVYFLLFNYTGLRFKLLAIGVGYLAGLGAELLGRKEGSKELGMIAAVFALMGIFGAQYFVARNWWNAESGAETKQSSYEANVAEAKKVVAAIPTGSDQEIRIYLAKEDAAPGEKPDPASISSEEIKDFRETTLPQMRDLAGGKVTKEQFEKKEQLELSQKKADKEEDESTFKAFFIILLMNRLNLVSMAAAAGIAFKVSSNA